MDSASNQQLRVVITGGPYSGKTALVRAMAERGYATVPEAAIEVIEDLTAEMGLAGQAAWRSENRVEFQERIITRQLELEADAAPAGPIFQDRSRLDGLAYCRVFASQVPVALQAACKQLPYDRVILLETIGRFKGRTESGRTSDYKRSLAIRDALREVYTEHGLEPIEIAEMPMRDRVNTVLASLRI
jgi:predicted ATPase